MSNNKVFLLIFFIILGACQAESTSGLVTMENVTFQDVMRFPAADIPITTATEAIHHATNLQTIKEALEEANRNMPSSVMWNLTAESSKDGNAVRWEVTIESTKLLPSFRCLILFDSNGEPLSNNPIDSHCGYSK